MRDMVTCFSEHALNVAHPSSSSWSPSWRTSPNCIPSRNPIIPSIQTAVDSLYDVSLSSTKHLLITVTWSRTQSNHALSLNFGPDPSSPHFKLLLGPSIFRREKGSKTLESHTSSRIEILWDLSSAKYGPGPEPVSGFYVLVSVDSELGLALGEDPGGRRAGDWARAAGASLISRREHFSGGDSYSTMARLSDSGSEHEIRIEHRGEGESGLRHPILCVWIDRTNVICVRRLRWNFRGNRAILVDGLVVDVMWDVHSWFFGSGSGCGVFMFKARKDVEKLKDERQKVDFSFFIHASFIRSDENRRVVHV